jgi:hypothetical protein
VDSAVSKYRPGQDPLRSMVFVGADAMGDVVAK